jgi:hypothetical protein
VVEYGEKRLPAEVLAYFRHMGAKGGSGKRSLETMTAAERSARAKKASLAAAAVRLGKGKRKSE